jgi:hypothetical protein
MDSSLQEQMAAFRYSLIAPIVSRQTPLMSGELKAYLAQTARQVYHIPGSTRTSVGLRTLERYLAQYRKGEWDALKPKGRIKKTSTRIPPAVLQDAIRLRRRVFASGQPFEAGQTATIGTDIVREDAGQLVRMGAADPAQADTSTPEPAARAPRRRSTRTDTQG